MSIPKETLCCASKCEKAHTRMYDSHPLCEEHYVVVEDYEKDVATFTKAPDDELLNSKGDRIYSMPTTMREDPRVKERIAALDKVAEARKQKRSIERDTRAVLDTREVLTSNSVKAAESKQSVTSILAEAMADGAHARLKEYDTMNKVASHAEGIGMIAAAEEKKPSKIASIGRTVKIEATEAGKRIAAAQFVTLVKKPIVELMCRNIAPRNKDLRKRIEAFMDSELGTSVLASLLSLVLETIPAGKMPFIPELASELRIKAMESTGNQLAEMLTGPLSTIASMYFTSDPSPEELPEGTANLLTAAKKVESAFEVRTEAGVPVTR